MVSIPVLDNDVDGSGEDLNFNVTLEGIPKELKSQTKRVGQLNDVTTQMESKIGILLMIRRGLDKNVQARAGVVSDWENEKRNVSTKSALPPDSKGDTES